MRKVMEDILLIAITIVGNILGILILNNVNVSKRILLIIGMDIFLYLFHFPIVCCSIVLAQILFQKTNIDFFFCLGIGMYMSFSVLVPLYSYSINSYRNKKKVFKGIVSFLASTVVFIVFFTLFIVIFNK